MDVHVFPIPIPPPTSLSTRSLWDDSFVGMLLRVQNVSVCCGQVKESNSQLGEKKRERWEYQTTLPASCETMYWLRSNS